MTDRKLVYVSSVSVLAALLLALLLPFGESGRIIAAILLLPAAALIYFFIKKRSVTSINKNQVLLIVTASAMIYIMLYYLSGIRFGFYQNPYALSVNSIFKYFLPIVIVIVSVEVIRYVLVAQSGRFVKPLCYLSCVVADVLICSTVTSVINFNRFMELVAGALLPALVANLLYNYLSARYGLFPSLVMHSLLALHSYVLPIKSGISDSIVHLFDLLVPIVIYLFIDFLYEKKKRYALGNASRVVQLISRIVTAIVLVFMLGTVMLVSNQFSYGALVIASESMTGELDKGDVVIFESYEDQPIEEGAVIVFESNRSMIVHRVVDIEVVNGSTRYYTKGDANEDNDGGFITDSDIVGITNYKLPSLGYPVLWLRSLFNH